MEFPWQVYCGNFIFFLLYIIIVIIRSAPMTSRKHGESLEVNIMEELKTFIIATTKEKTDSVINFVFDHIRAKDVAKLYIVNSPEIMEEFRRDIRYKMKLMLDNEVYFEPVDIFIDFNTLITQEIITKLSEKLSQILPSEKKRVYVYIDRPGIPVIDTLKAISENCTIKSIFIGEDAAASMKEKEVK